MGWTGLHREKGLSHLEFFRSEFCPNEPERLIAASSAGTTVYCVYKTRTGARIALVVLTQRSNEYFNFTYKDMEESMGPSEAKCPKKILELLDPLEVCYSPGSDGYEYAKEWRERCWAEVERREAKPKVKVGDVVVFPDDSWVTKRTGCSRFRFLGHTKMQRADGRADSLYRISRWRDEEFTVERAA